jgi:type 1 glutamine amidotransferase
MGTREAAPIENFVNLFGGCHGGPDRSHRVFDDADLTVADGEHPITRGIGSFRVREEFYYRLKFVKPPGSVHPILQMPVEGNLETVAWSWERPDGGRSFGFSGLHFHSNWAFEQYRRLAVQSVLWTLRLPIPEDGISVPISDRDLRGQ